VYASAGEGSKEIKKGSRRERKGVD
jgi:hypothetical protein